MARMDANRPLVAGSARSGKGTRAERRIVTVALLLAMTVVSLEQTVVSTAMPSIIAALKGLEIYPWVFSAYLLAATVTTPIYGKLADLLGRKRVLLFGLGLFALGSMLSGMAQSMPELIAMRVVQGLGAGAVGPIVLTMLGDLFTIEERARVQGWFSAVWGVSSLAGPALGGVLTDQLSWRWVFFVTVPFAVGLGLDPVRSRPREGRAARGPADRLGGGALLTLGSVVLLLAVLKGGERLVDLGGVAAAWPWRWSCSGRSWSVERIAADPILPLDLILSAHIGSAIAGSFLIGGAAVRARHLCPAVRPGGARRDGDAGGAGDHAAVPELGDQRGGRGQGGGPARVPADGGRRLDPDRRAGRLPWRWGRSGRQASVPCSRWG